MANAILIGHNTLPNYICLSTDIVSSTLIGASIKGYTVLATDTGNWYLVDGANTLVSYSLPTSGGGGGGAVTIANGADVALGSTTDAAVSTDANGTINAHMRGIVKLLAAKIGITIADGDNTTEGTIADVAVSTDANGTINAHLRGIVKLLAAGTILGAGTALIGKTATTAKSSATGDTEIDASTAGADGQSNSSNRLKVSDHINSYNGATWDRVRSGITTIGSTFTGFLNGLPWGIFNTTPTTRTTGQGGPLETSSDGSLRVIPSSAGNDVNIETSGTDATSNTQNNLTVTARGKVYNGSTWDRIREATADALAVTGLQGIANMVWNGSSWDRQAGNTNGQFSQGNVASGATDSGNPLKMGGRYNTTFPTLTDGQRGDIQLSSRGLINTVLCGSSSTPAIVGAVADATAGAAALYVSSYETLYNNSTFDRMRNNYESTILASAARSADTNSSDQTNYNARGVVITIDLTVLGSTSITFTVTYKDSLSGKYQTLLASSALVGTGTTSLTIYPGITATTNSSISFPLPRLYRVQSVRGGTPGTDTYSISTNYIL